VAAAAAGRFGGSVGMVVGRLNRKVQQQEQPMQVLQLHQCQLQNPAAAADKVQAQLHCQEQQQQARL
jgi:hypothetical protein